MTELFVFVLFLVCALEWSQSILEFNAYRSVANVWLTAVASVLLIAVPLESSASETWLVWTAFAVVVFHHVVIDGILWSGPLLQTQSV